MVRRAAGAAAAEQQSLLVADSKLLVLLASGCLAPVSQVHGDRLLALNLESREMQLASVSVTVHGEALRLWLGGRLAVFGNAKVDNPLQVDGTCCLLPHELLRRLPQDQHGRFLSKGSCSCDELCDSCAPCKFNGTVRGCKDGLLCGLCHFPHTGLTRTAKRAILRKGGRTGQRLAFEEFVDPAFHELVASLCAPSPSLRRTWQ